MAKKEVDVAIGLLFSHGKVLVGWRNKEQHQGNKNEFPGGKIEKNETAVQACRREVKEEVGIDLENWLSWDELRYEYDDVIVRLFLFYSYVPDHLLAVIQHPWQWYSRDELASLNFPKANDPIIQRMLWSPYIKISSEILDLERLNLNMMLYARNITVEQMKHLNKKFLSQLILNIDLAHALTRDEQRELGAIHIKQHQLKQFTANDLNLGCRYIAACHDLEGVLYAEKIGCEAAFLSPINTTNTHTNEIPLGWTAFKSIAQRSHILIFALGGVTPKDLTTVQDCQAYGVAGISAF
ncbi:NUDIX domain-containing protein [Acinetobacter nectaris]|uniref:NUDIX domain-containing protein n=1 Tax=Acinetobacter nectaris TaxID=1219382 RepID=UPI001F46B67F|nr:thiamine phosphate synthase [Acinetobacter nectaris]MCF9045252.1 thiamine phosphate synthase [Acinetobacter nectaris]